MSTAEGERFVETTLGRTGLKVGRLGIGASYGVPARAIEQAFERGANYLYWGSMRTREMTAAIRALAPRHRDRMVIAIQSYSRIGQLVEPSVERGLKQLGLSSADILVLGWWNRPPSRGVMDAALRAKERGLVRFLGISCHRRPSFRDYLAGGRFDLFMVRYNAAHRGAETEVFPFLPPGGRPGIVSYTATRWGYLMSPRWTPKGEPVPTASDCYRFALSNPNVDLCLTGAANAEQMAHALTALEKGLMSDEELAWMRRVGDFVHRRGKRLPLPWANLVHPFGARGAH